MGNLKIKKLLPEELIEKKEEFETERDQLSFNQKEKNDFNKFIREINKAANQFYVWQYSNNYLAEYQDYFNENVEKENLYFKDEAIDRSRKYKNFWNVVIPSLQHGWILAIARLLDPPFLIKENGEKEFRVSIKFIIDRIADEDLKKNFVEKFKPLKKFEKSIISQRHNFLVHNSIDFESTKIKSGVEDFFDILDWLVKELKNKNSHLKSCGGIDLEFIEKLSETGVKELFNEITKK